MTLPTRHISEGMRVATLRNKFAHRSLPAHLSPDPQQQTLYQQLVTMLRLARRSVLTVLARAHPPPSPLSSRRIAHPACWRPPPGASTSTRWRWHRSRVETHRLPPNHRPALAAPHSPPRTHSLPSLVARVPQHATVAVNGAVPRRSMVSTSVAAMTRRARPCVKPSCVKLAGPHAGSRKLSTTQHPSMVRPTTREPRCQRIISNLHARLGAGRGLAAPGGTRRLDAEGDQLLPPPALGPSIPPPASIHPPYRHPPSPPAPFAIPSVPNSEAGMRI